MCRAHWDGLRGRLRSSRDLDANSTLMIYQYAAERLTEIASRLSTAFWRLTYFAAGQLSVLIELA